MRFLLLASSAALSAGAQTAPPPVTPPKAVARQTDGAAPRTAAPANAAPQTTPAIPPAGSPSEAEAAAPDAEGESGEGEEIVVTGRKPVGSVVGDIPPEQTLSPADIRSYGVSSVADLLTELSPQTYIVTFSGSAGAKSRSA